MIVFSPDQPDEQDSAVRQIIEGVMEALRAQEVLAAIGHDVNDDAVVDAVGYDLGDTVTLDDDLDDLFEEEDDELGWDSIIDLSHLDRVVYLFLGAAPDGGDIEIVVEEPLWLYAAEGDPNKYIEDADGTGFIISPNGRVTELHPKVGESVFT